MIQSYGTSEYHRRCPNKSSDSQRLNGYRCNPCIFDTNMSKLRVDMLNLSDILSTVTVIFLVPELYSFDEFTEHVNTVPFNVLFTDCSVRVLVVDTGDRRAAAAVTSPQ